MDFEKFAALQKMTTKQRLKVISTDLVNQTRITMDNDRKPTAEQIADGMVEGKTYNLSFDEQIVIGDDFVKYLSQFMKENKNNILLNFKITRIMDFITNNFSIELKVVYTKKVKDIVGMTDVIREHVNNNNLTKYTRRLRTK